ncbi:MAG: phage major capsid protein [Actinomycetales bacterium]
MASLIEIMETRQAEIETEIETIVSAAETETRAVSDDEQTNIDALLVEHRSLKGKIDAQKQADELRAQRSANTPKGVAPTGPARTENRTEPYRKGGEDSYFRDLNNATKGDRRAIERLTENDRYTADKGRDHARAEIRAMSTAAGSGGEFAPPMWQVDEFVGYRRPGRPTADILNHEALPYGISSINLPTVTLGALTGTQGSQNAAVANRDFTTGSVTGSVNTIAGQVVISQQDLDQTPINLDTVILGDLQRDYDLQLDVAVIASLAGVSGLNAVTYTDASPTTAKLLPYTQQAIDKVHTGIFAPPRAIVMRPDRWGRIKAAVDSTGRPLVTPDPSYSSYNTFGLAEGQVPQGFGGNLNAVPVIMDASIPANLGAGTNQDEIFVLDPSQITLYESAPKAETFQQTYANQLSVLCRFYAYYTVIPNRLPKAISLITGTGLIPYAYGS